MTLAGALLLVLMLWAEPSYAAEGHGTSVTQLIYPLINFLIFVYLIKRFGVPWAREQVRARRERLLAAAAEARSRKERAEAEHQRYRALLEKSEEEARTVAAMLRADGEKQKAKILSEANDLARKIIADAEFQARQEIKMARQRLLEELAAAAREEAEKLIRRHFTPGDQARLVEEFLSQLEQPR
jgi:F-type H+-transporting ATPase subunit b